MGLVLKYDMSNRNVLPVAYLEVEYLQSDLQEYINTGYIPTPHTQIYIKFSVSNISRWKCIIGSENSLNGCLCRISILNSGHIYPISYAILANTIYNVGYNKEGKLFVDDYVSSRTILLGNYPLYIFALNRANTTTDDNNPAMGMRIYKCAISDNTGGQRNFIPCYRKSDNKPGMFDTITLTFYTNSASTGEFVVGPAINDKYEYNCGIGKAACPYDPTIYTEPDGSRWVRISHHNNPSSLKIFSSTDDPLNCYKDDDRWMYMEALNHVWKWELMIKLLETSASAPMKFRFVLNTNPNTTTSNTGVTYTALSGYTSSNWGAIRKYSSSTFYCCSTNAWWGSFGTYSNWGNYNIPGWNSQYISTGFMDLYLRVDYAKPEYVATINNVGYSTDGPTGRGSYYFNGNDGYIKLDSFDTPYPVTYSVWQKLSNYNIHTLDIRDNNGSGAQPLYRKRKSIETGGSRGYVTITHSIDCDDEVWHLITVTQGNNLASLYIDGEFIGTVNCSQISFINNPIHIGCRYTKTAYARGYMHDLRIYNHELTLDEIKAIYNEKTI